ncbi:hypothetical protein BVRB_6g146860 [Beta vulgaris subsp. vulgaris]|nr:hypothetical protein BVRB_6g146860 [Beta vulgaris subsp. vulgaris]
MLLLSATAIPSQYSLSNPTISCVNPNLHYHFYKSQNSYSPFPLLSKPSSLPNSSSSLNSTCTATLRYVNDPILEEEGGDWVPSASAVASAIRKASSSPIEFTQKIERDPKSQGIVLPSPDFQKLCLDQLALFRRIVDPSALLSVYVRPAGSYVMDRLELRRVTFYPTVDGSDIVILVGNFSVPAGLRGAESALSNLQAKEIPEYRAVVFPMVKHPFVVGFLVAEIPGLELGRGSHDASQFPSPEECYALPPTFDLKSPEIPLCSEKPLMYLNLSADQRLNAINISHSIAMAYVMDQVDDTVDDERPPRGRDQGHAAVHLEGRTVTPVIQENLDRPVTAGHLENVLNDFQARMAAVMEEQIKNNMLFFQMSPREEAAAPLKGRSQEGRPGPSRPPRPELTKPPSKGKQPAVSDSRRKMDWKLVVRPADNIPPTGHMMETDAREYLEAKRAAAQQRSASGSTPYMKDPSLRLPSRTVVRSRGPSAFQPRQEKTVLQPMVYRRQALANTSSNPVLKEYRQEHIPIEGQVAALQINWPTPFSIGSLYGDQQAARECYLTTLKPSSWKEKAECPRAQGDDSAKKVKGQISELKEEIEKVQESPFPESTPSMLLPSKKRKCLALKEEKHSSEIMAIMSLGLERPAPVESPVEICLNPERPERTLKIGSVLRTEVQGALKAMLLQQTSWQNNIRMSNLVEQIRGPLSSLRTLSKMLAVQIKRSEIAHDIVEDIMVQSDRMLDTLQQLQDAVLLTKANIMRFNEESLKKMDGSNYAQPEPRMLPNDMSSQTSADKGRSFDRQPSLSLAVKDLEMPMPPLALAPLQENGIRPCNVSDVLVNLVGAAQPLAQNQKRILELSEFSHHLPVAVEEPALRQALSNLIEGALLRTHVGGRVEILSVGAPAGGALVVIDDDGPDMHYMTQMHSLTPFGDGLLSEKMVEDNMTWNFVAGITVAREILESYGCVVRVISPRNKEAALGTGGTRVEVWLPSLTPYNHSTVADGA